MVADAFDVAVVGGGLVGVATAWGLAREGCRVAVLDEGDRAVRASRGNFALVWVQSKGLGLAPYAGWTIRSSNQWGGFADLLKQETGLDVSFQRPGGFHLALSERELETVMLDFYHRQFNVLVCTTIIESGIDVPTANTIVIDRADMLGLAQLHQLRGRVGRSHLRACAR